MSTNIKPASFDYGTLEDASIERLTSLLSKIQRTSRTSAKNTLETGKALLDAKSTFGHGNFKLWVESQCGFCMRTAERYMRFAIALAVC